VVVYPEFKNVEALSIRQAIQPVYQEAYPEKGKVIWSLKKNLNDFSQIWLHNFIDQGHGKEWQRNNG